MPATSIARPRTARRPGLAGGWPVRALAVLLLLSWRTAVLDAQKTDVIELANGETRGAVVRSVTPSLDPESRTATVVLQPEGIDGLTQGQGLRARIRPGGGDDGRIALPERCANVCFGGLKRNRLFMAASQSIYALYVNTQGAPGG